MACPYDDFLTASPARDVHGQDGHATLLVAAPPQVKVVRPRQPVTLPEVRPTFKHQVNDSVSVR
jgi:hypothetical protein